MMFDMDQPPFISDGRQIAIASALAVSANAFCGRGERADGSISISVSGLGQRRSAAPLWASKPWYCRKRVKVRSVRSPLRRGERGRRSWLDFPAEQTRAEFERRAPMGSPGIAFGFQDRPSRTGGNF
jgi:hypothetical protein